MSPPAKRRPAATPSAGPRARPAPKRASASASAVDPASQTATGAAAGARSVWCVSTSEKASSTRPTNASATAICSCRASRPGCPRAVTSASTAIPDAQTAWTSERGASRRAAT